MEGSELGLRHRPKTWFPADSFLPVGAPCLRSMSDEPRRDSGSPLKDALDGRNELFAPLRVMVPTPLCH